MNVSTLAAKILKLSPSIRYVTVASLNGKILISTHKKTVKTTLSRAESRQSLLMAARGWKQRWRFCHFGQALLAWFLSENHGIRVYS